MSDIIQLIVSNTYLLVYGDVVGGCGFIGPFSTKAEAVAWGEHEMPSDYWIVTELEKPFRPKGGA